MTSRSKETTMAKNKLPRIYVTTLPNGYAFTVDGNEYMCFTPEQLVDEVFVRIAIGMREYLNKENVAAIMETCAKWPDIKDAAKAHADLLAQLRRAQKHESAAVTAQAKANQRADKLEAENRRLNDKNYDLIAENELLKKKLSQFMPSSSHSVVLEEHLTKGKREMKRRLR